MRLFKASLSKKQPRNRRDDAFEIRTEDDHRFSVIELTASDDDQKKDNIDDHRMLQVDASFNSSLTNIEEAHQNKSVGKTADSIDEPSSSANLIEMHANSQSYLGSKEATIHSSC